MRFDLLTRFLLKIDENGLSSQLVKIEDGVIRP